MVLEGVDGLREAMFGEMRSGEILPWGLCINFQGASCRLTPVKTVWFELHPR